MRQLDVQVESRHVAVDGALTADARPRVGQVLGKALRDFYEHSWRLLVLNAGLSLFALAFLVAAQPMPLGLSLLLLAVALGPPALALMHCAATVVETEDLELGEFVRGLRLHWRRGLLLGSAAAAFAALTAVAIGFYAGRNALSWMLAMVVLYIAGLVGVFQLTLWPLAVVQRDVPLATLVRHAALVAARRPRATVGLAASLLAVNLLGIVAAVLPFLTMTVSYSFLAAAHFVLPQMRGKEA